MVPGRTLGALTAAAALTAITASAAFAGATAPYFDVGKLPEPPVTGREMAVNTEAFSTTYTSRYTGTLAELQAAQSLVDELEGEGYDAAIVDQPQAGEPRAVTHAVVATRKGTTHPDEEIVFSTHYDAFPRTINAAYDNATGVQMLRALAKSISKIPTNRTFTFAFYNGEEEGALGSGPMAKSYKTAGRKVRALLGFDMVGIAWPVAAPGDTNCLCMWRGEDDDAFDGLLSHVNFDVLKFPDQENLVEVRGLNDRNSDEDSWDLQGYPTMRWAGLEKAADYPEYHTQSDDMAAIDKVAGGRQFFEAGLRNTLLSSYYTALAMDNDPPVARATATGSGPVAFDAAGSGDPDGAPSGYEWRFGDGTTATGATVYHAYARPGDYVATLLVGDNLWPQVTASTAVPVHVTSGTAPAPKPSGKKKKTSACVRKAKRIKTAKKRKAALKRCAKVHAPRKR
jgi:hypothetical protein